MMMNNISLDTFFSSLSIYLFTECSDRMRRERGGICGVDSFFLSLSSDFRAQQKAVNNVEFSIAHTHTHILFICCWQKMLRSLPASGGGVSGCRLPSVKCASAKGENLLLKKSDKFFFAFFAVKMEGMRRDRSFSALLSVPFSYTSRWE